MRVLVRSGLITLSALAVIAGGAAPGLIAAPGRAVSRQAPSLDETIAATYQAAYSLDIDVALTSARRLVAEAPDDTRTHRTLAAVLWFDILFQRGAVTIDHYLGGVAKAQLSLPGPPPTLDAEFKKELARSIELAEAALKKDPKNVQAIYDAGTAYGLQASYAASIDGSMVSAFRLAKRAYDAEEDVLERAPDRVSAGVIVGTYRYLVSTLGVPARMFAYMAGFGGGKEKGIALLERATTAGDSKVEARTALLLIYTLESRHADAVAMVKSLAAEYPRNRLFVLEQGATENRAGRFVDAEATLTRGLQAFDQDTRPKVPGERALWLYKRGLARLGLLHRLDATADLEAALQAAPVEWTRGRIMLALGRAAMLSGKPQEAIARFKEAKQIAEAINDPLAAGEASRQISRGTGSR